MLTRTMKKITDIVGAVGTKLRDRSRTAPNHEPDRTEQTGRLGALIVSGTGT